MATDKYLTMANGKVVHIYDADVLTEEGTATPWFETLMSQDHTFHVDVGAVAGNVVVRAEGRNSKQRAFHLDDRRPPQDETYSVDGSYLIHKPSFTCDEMRLVFVSNNGGAPTVALYYRGK